MRRGLGLQSKKPKDNCVRRVKNHLFVGKCWENVTTNAEMSRVGIRYTVGVSSPPM